jgi:XTP/dITP diphosphohydrolase
MITLLIATRNRHKVGEIRSILGAGFECRALSELGDPPEIVEDAPTFAGNAIKKSLGLAKWLAGPTVASMGNPGDNRYVLADDSGLEVDALNGAPGVHSARFAAGEGSATVNSPDELNNAKLLRLLEGVPREKRTARFRCVLALTPVVPVVPEASSPVCYADAAELGTQLFEGVCDGRIGLAPKGGGGFGYDPLFTPDGYDRTFAELGEEVKNQLSHRARALAALKTRLTA